MLKALSWIAVTVLLSFPASAEERASGVTVGIGAGTANVDFDRGFDASDTALSVFAVYDLNRYLAVEGGYVDAGSAEENGVVVESRYAAIMALGSLPIGNRWSIFARIGAAAGSWESGSFKREDTTFAYGLGTAVGFGGLRLRLIGDSVTIEQARIVHLSLQAGWRF